MPPKRKLSFVWNIFERSTLDSSLAVCSICKKQYATSHNTSNLMDHIKRKHPDKLEEGTNMDMNFSKRPKQNFVLKSYLETGDENYKEKIDRKLAMMIAIDLQPYSLVEDRGFTELLKLLAPNYKIPCRKTFSEKLVPKLYEELSSKLKNILNSIEWISLTTDIWTSMNSQSYCTVTCHFIFNYNLCSAVLETVELAGSHTASCIKDFIESVLSKWNLKLSQVVCCTTDNGANIKAACALLSITHLPCMAHTLNLCIEDVIKKSVYFNDVVKKCRNIVTFFKRSNLAMDILRLEQANANKQQLKLLKDVETRWNSIFKMLERILEIGDPLTIAISKAKNAPPILTAEDINIIQDWLKILKVIDDSTTAISGEQYPTSSIIIPITIGIHTKISRINVDSTAGREVQHILLESIEKRLFTYEKRHSLQIATLLDPRIKKMGFRLAENASNGHKLLKEELIKSIKEKASPSTSTITNNDNQYNHTEVAEAEIFEYDCEVHKENIGNNYESNDLFDFIRQRKDEIRSRTSISVDASILAQIRQYFEDEHRCMSSKPLEYWKEKNDSVFEKVVNKYFSIPATSVPSERVFSRTGNIINVKRSKLKPKNVNILTFIGLNQWLIE